MKTFKKKWDAHKFVAEIVLNVSAVVMAVITYLIVFLIAAELTNGKPISLLAGILPAMMVACIVIYIVDEAFKKSGYIK